MDWTTNSVTNVWHIRGCSFLRTALLCLIGTVLYSRARSNGVKVLMEGQIASHPGCSCTWSHVRRHWCAKVDGPSEAVQRHLRFGRHCSVMLCRHLQIYGVIMSYCRTGKTPSFFSLPVHITMTDIFKWIRKSFRIRLHFILFFFVWAGNVT